MAEPATMFTPEQTLDAAREIMKANGDEFRIKVSRAKPGQTYPEHVATLDGASIDHAAHPEPWLARLAGGGRYYLSLFHNSNRSKAIGGVILVNASGASRDVDTAAVRAGDWQGPPVLVSPAAPPVPEQPYTVIDASPAPGTSRRLAATDQSGAGGGGLLDSYGPRGAPRDSVREAQLISLEREREEMRRREREMQEERHRNELVVLQEKQAAEMARLRAEMLAQKPQGEDPLTKMLMLMREEQKAREAQEESRRREDREREERRIADERAREERRAERESQDRKEREQERARLEERLAAERKAADDRFMGLLGQLTQKKEDPLLTALIEKGDRSAEQTAKVMASMSEAASGVINMAMGLVHSMNELNTDSEPPMLKFTREIMAGIAKISASSQPVIKPAPLPRPARTTTVPVQPQPARTNGAAPAAPQTPAPQPRRMRSPAEVAREAETAHLASPPTPPAPNAPPMFDEAPDQGAPSATRMEQIVAAIKAQDEIPFVASFFLNNITEPSVAAAIQKGDGSPVMAFVPYLMEWLEQSEDHRHYVHDLVIEMFQQGEQRGFFPAGSAEQMKVQADQMFEEGEEEEEEEEVVTLETEPVEVQVHGQG